MRICNRVTGTVADVRDDFVLYGDWVRDDDSSLPVPRSKLEPVKVSEPKTSRKNTNRREGVKSCGV